MSIVWEHQSASQLSFQYSAFLRDVLAKLGGESTTRKFEDELILQTEALLKRASNNQSSDGDVRNWLQSSISYLEWVPTTLACFEPIRRNAISTFESWFLAEAKRFIIEYAESKDDSERVSDRGFLFAI
jgi:hypothetical protein